MKTVTDIIDRLAETRHLPTGEYAALLSPSLGNDDAARLSAKAREVTDRIFGRKVRVRGLLEITNVCRNNCLYCGLRRDNHDVSRYTLSEEEIIRSCHEGYAAGLRTFVLQGGENPALSQQRIADIVKRLHDTFPDAAITLSLGEWPDEAYEAFRKAGASRYLLRHETRDPQHYSHLHPADMSLDNRLRCLDTLKRLGYQTGTGIMVGSPGQTIGHIVKDLEYMHHLNPEMIGIGPFVPSGATPFASHHAGSVELTIRLISILRLMFPYANIPSTTALATLSGSDGRNRGILAGANVVMPNISPLRCRESYSIYDNKAATGAEAAEGLELLARELSRIGMEITTERGNYNPTLNVQTNV